MNLNESLNNYMAKLLNESKLSESIRIYKNLDDRFGGSQSDSFDYQISIKEFINEINDYLEHIHSNYSDEAYVKSCERICNTTINLLNNYSSATIYTYFDYNRLYINNKEKISDQYDNLVIAKADLEVEGQSDYYIGKVEGFVWKKYLSTYFIYIPYGDTLNVNLFDFDSQKYVNKVNHKNKKKLIILDESQLNESNQSTQLMVSDLDIQDITLLSVEEAEQVLEEYRKFYGRWWLRSPGYYRFLAADVDCDGSVIFFGHGVGNVDSCVRPALIISNLKSFNLPLYSRVELDNGTKWIVISDNMLLCNDESFGKHRVDENSNNYEKSEIKQYIQDKAKELGFNNIGTPISRKVNHKNKKKLVILDENNKN